MGHAANLFEKLMVRTPEVAALLAKSYIGMSEPNFIAKDLFYNMIKQTRKSRPSRFFRKQFGIRPILYSPTRPVRFSPSKRQT